MADVGVSTVLPNMPNGETLRTTAGPAARAVSAERQTADRLGLRRFGRFETQAELTAHFRILDIIAARRAAPGFRAFRSTGRKLRNKHLDDDFIRRFMPQLDAFAPRCPCGRGPLRVKHEIGLKRFSCVCGFRGVEAR